MTWTPVFISAFALSGIAVVWRSWLRDHPAWTTWLNHLPYRLGKVFTCGTCFTCWLTLAFLLVFQPFSQDFLIHSSMPSSVQFLFQFCVQWMALAWLALIGRFAYAALEEIVFFFVHRVREGHAH